MGTQIRVMDLAIDLLTEETLRDKLNEYLSNDYLNVVHLISVDYLEEFEKKETVYNALMDADLVLPGEKVILNQHHVDVLEAGNMVVKYQDMIQAMNHVLLHNKKCYFIMRTKAEAQAIYRYIRKKHWGCQCVGIYAADADVSQEALVNDINTQLPDVIYLSLDKGQQEEFIMNNKSKLNAKLCLCIGGITPLIIRENPYVPHLMQVLHLSRLYSAIYRIPAMHSRRKRIFKRKVANYNSKKAEEENEDNTF